MPRFFFDVFNGESDTVDLTGQDLQDEDAARGAALQMLAGIAHDDILRGGDARTAVRVRRGSVPLYHVVMTLSEHWIRLDS
ncbi:DUF6894 family protein [Bosea rubneri]|uniref:DUF6894 domain-containing protein n=1 Tax=Bosea rubneri TaxID=3075434 RepID=A0ABU3SEI1_9HYPH|nr:hypothetical protein [Bosea sp. ZW T0_25]MDU0343210.1 hypothetical protein [Bosea sp. ZW T0_25]